MHKNCHSCGGSEFYYNLVTLHGPLTAILPTGFFSSGTARLRICGACGLVDWFADAATLAEVKKRLPKDIDG